MKEKHGEGVTELADRRTEKIKRLDVKWKEKERYACVCVFKWMIFEDVSPAWLRKRVREIKTNSMNAVEYEGLWYC